MALKPPVRGTTTVQIHGEPAPSPGYQPPSVHPPHFDGRPGHKTPLARPTIDVELDTIRPAPPGVTVNGATDSTPAPKVAERPLRDYWISVSAVLPPPDAQGVSTFKGRSYVKVSGGRFVQISADPVSGLYRARLPNEPSASGPVLRYDANNGLWQTPEYFAPSTYPLTVERLRGFRTGLELSAVGPGSDGLYRFDDKLYVVIDNYAYQVLHDLDASAPQTAVMRIVRPEDPIATDERNRYVATRPGRSEPIVFDARYGWRGTLVGGAEGMHRMNRLQRDLTKIELERQDQDIARSIAKSFKLRSIWEAAKGTRHEERTLEAREEQHLHDLQILKDAVRHCRDNKPAITALLNPEGYQQRFIELQKKRIFAYTLIIESSLTRQQLRGSLFALPPTEMPWVVSFLGKQLSYLKKRRQIADELVKKWRAPVDDVNEEVTSPLDTFLVVAMWVTAKSKLLDNPLATGSAPRAPYLAAMLSQVTTTYAAFEHIPANTHGTILNHLSEECASIRAWYERLELPPGPEHVTSRNEISAEIKVLEDMLEQDLNRYHHAHGQQSVPPADEQAIDFDFIPNQDRSAPDARPWRIFRARRHGIYRINIGEPRRTAQGDEVIEVRNPHDPTQHLQTYQKRDGEWRPLRLPQEKNLATLNEEALLHLEQTEAYLQSAWREERGKNNPDNIVEALTGKARELDDIALQLQRFEATDSRAGTLIGRLGHESQRLRTEGENIRIRIYKDKAFLSAGRVIYLIDKGHVGAIKTETRLKRGKGKEREFLDLYSLIDAHTREPLWDAHFHYASKETPDLNFNVRGAHLKTLEQSAMGISSQRREERAGRQHIAIWREYIDGRLAQRIFDLAAELPASAPNDTSKPAEQPDIAPPQTERH